MKEIWKDIKGYEGLYQVSNLGNVRSMDRITRDGRKIKGKFDSIKEKTSKPINQYDMNGKFIKRFKSLSDVPFKGKGNISQCANNKKESSYGYKWKYDNNKYTLFVFSDPHAFYNETITALKKAGYNEANPHHKLVCLGDFTDRGEQSLGMYEYLHRLSIENKAIVLPGNHTKFFIDFLEGSYSPFNYLHNGLNETIADFWQRTAPFESWCLLEGQCEMNQENYARWVDMSKRNNG